MGNTTVKKDGLRIHKKVERNIEYRPLISIITIVFNGEEYLEKTIKSVISQTCADIEYVVVDGGSNDNTLSVIKKYNNQIHCWVSEFDEGISDAFNKGIKLASGNWMLFLNAGDIFCEANTLEKISRILIDNSDKDIVYGNIDLVNEGYKLIKTYGHLFNKKDFERKMIIPHQSIFHNKNIFDKYGLHNKKYKRAMDYELLLRIENPKFEYHNMTITKMLSGGVSQQQVYKVYVEYYQAQLENLKYKSRISLSYVLFCNLLKIYAILFFHKIIGYKSIFAR